jgi:hypothetical protein
MTELLKFQYVLSYLYCRQRTILRVSSKGIRIFNYWFVLVDYLTIPYVSSFYIVDWIVLKLSEITLYPSP